MPRCIARATWLTPRASGIPRGEPRAWVGGDAVLRQLLSSLSVVVVDLNIVGIAVLPTESSRRAVLRDAGCDMRGRCNTECPRSQRRTVLRDAGRDTPAIPLQGIVLCTAENAGTCTPPKARATDPPALWRSSVRSLYSSCSLARASSRSRRPGRAGAGPSSLAPGANRG